MALQLSWRGEDDLDRVAETRMLCYSTAANTLENFRTGIRADRRARPGDYLLAERDGLAVGTATHMDLTMWIGGKAMACQGVAYVGTIKTQRRVGAKGEAGVASQVMREMQRGARERGKIITALMPFRVSYYEHFGYGIVEQRDLWTVPLAILPGGEFDGIGIMSERQLPLLQRLHQLNVEQGQCEVKRSSESWELRKAPNVWWQFAGNGLEVLDVDPHSGDARGYACFTQENEDGKNIVKVIEHHFADQAALLRMLRFFGSLRDQYSFLRMQFPNGFRFNWLLKEKQLPHRSAEHAAASLTSMTRMQLRILDHLQFFAGLCLRQSPLVGQAVVEVRESEGHASRFGLQIDKENIAAKASQATPDFACADYTWASIACGHLPASQALRLGMAEGSETAAALLDVFSFGPTPFCNEFF